jgi:hypothetical protein
MQKMISSKWIKEPDSVKYHRYWHYQSQISPGESRFADLADLAAALRGEIRERRDIEIWLWRCKVLGQCVVNRRCANLHGVKCNVLRWMTCVQVQ